MRFENKVVMVTGGAAGIGRVTAENFAGEGARIAICDVNPEAGEAAVKALGPDASFEQVDVASNTAVSNWVEGVFDKYGQIDVLVNNAGITRDGLIMRMKEEDWDAVINVNLKSAFNCIKAVSKIMVKQRSGRIINLASVVGVITLIVYVILMPLLVFFFLKDKRLIIGWMVKHMPRHRSFAGTVWKDVDRQIANYVRGKFWEIVIIWAASLVTFTLFASETNDQVERLVRSDGLLTIF